jgi:hypothetical protein
MSMSLDNAMWLALILIEAAIVGLLLYRRVWRILPVFCVYCIWDLSSNVGAYLINHYDPRAYFTAYLMQLIVDSALEFGVLVELAWSVLRPLRASLSRLTLLVIGALILLAGAAIWPFAALPGLVHVSKQSLLLVQLQQTVSILRILLFLLLAGFSQLLSISWRDRELQVATGLGLYSLAGLAAAMIHMRQTTASQYQHLGELVVAGNICCLLYWVFSFAQKEAARREFTPQMQNMLLSVAGAARVTRVALQDSGVGKKLDDR